MNCRDADTPLSLLGAAALAISLTACGGDDGGANYCDKVKAMGDDAGLTDLMASDDPGTAGEISEAYQKIADAAPGDVKEDWQAVADSIKAMEDIDLEDPDALAEIEFDHAALDRTVQHADSECGIS